MGRGLRGDMRRVGVLGGTFDPPHVGHLILGEVAREQLGLDVVLFVPAGQPPHKTDRSITPVRHRQQMTQLAIADNAHFQLDTTDIERPAPHYTSTLLPLLQAKYMAELWLLIGSDSLADFLSWHEPAAVLAHCHLGVLPRPGSDVEWEPLVAELPILPEKVDWLVGPSIALSSTHIRERVRQNQSLRYLIPPAVLDFIERIELYRR